MTLLAHVGREQATRTGSSKRHSRNLQKLNSLLSISYVSALDGSQFRRKVPSCISSALTPGVIIMFCGRSFPSPTMSSPFPSKRGISTAMLLLLQVLFFICSAIPRVQTISVNRTIDDTYGDPSTGTYPTYNTEDWIPSLAPANWSAVDDTLHGCGRPTVDGDCSMTLHFEGKDLPLWCESEYVHTLKELPFMFSGIASHCRILTSIPM
ncbi:hypothetical protein C8J57DRAFT_336493 [Mycena rebaudengoi]|nr:hypothetical protein C8J57DRAFT_336493 [Mycena rebaudengoi]